MVKGFAALNRKLTKKIPELVYQRLRPVLEKAAEDIVSDAKSFVPIEFGDLRDSIGWTWGKPPGGTVIIGKSAKIGRGMRITIYAGNAVAFYARWVEYGTNPHTNKGRVAGSSHPGSFQRPFMRNAFKKNKNRIKARFTKAIRAALRESNSK